MLIEYVPYGDLLGYLRKSRGLNDTYYKDPDVKPQTSLTSQQLMKFAWQIADGMSYLSSKSVSLMIYIPMFYQDLQVFATGIMKLSLLVSISKFVEVTKSTSWRVYVEGVHFPVTLFLSDDVMPSLNFVVRVDGISCARSTDLSRPF